MDHHLDRRDTESSDESRADVAPAHRIAQWARTARAIGRAHARELLGWVWRWRIIDAHVVRALLGVSRSGAYRILARLRRHELLQRVLVDGTPASPWMLTPAGADVIAPHLDPDELELSPLTALDRIRAAQVPHDLLMQHFALRLAHRPPQVVVDLIARRRAEVAVEVGYALDDGEAVIHPAAWFETMEVRSAGKYPDAVIEYVIDRGAGASVLVAVECQQTPDPRHVREQILAGYCEALGADRQDYQWAGVDLVAWCSTRPGIPPLYRSLLGPGLTGWHRTDSRHWIRVPGTYPYQNWMADRVLEIAAPKLESLYYRLVLGG